jgi:hypothetical protein
MRISYLCFVIFVIIINSAVSWRTFWKGRKVNGNLGDPTKFHHDSESFSKSEDLWFEQKLDHFNPRNDKTFEQVKSSIEGVIAHYLIKIIFYSVTS